VGELNPTTTVAIFAFLAIVVPAFITDRRAAKRDEAAALREEAAALKVAEQVAGVASKAEEAAALVVEVANKTEGVKRHLIERDANTNGKLDKIHDLVNNTYSEQLKLTEALAEMLLAENPASEKYQLIAERARAAVTAHQPAESTKREAKTERG
jgi:hypothetical protein